MWYKTFLFLVFSVCVFEATHTFDDPSNLAILYAKCGEVTDLDPAEIEKLSILKPVDTDDRRVKCFVRCVITGLKMMNIAGELTPDEVPDIFPYKNYTAGCTNVKTEDSCEKAFTFHKCLTKKIKELKEKSE